MPRMKTETIGAGDQSWLGSTHGVYNCRTGTLSLAAFTAATHYPDGYIRSGTPVGLITATDMYGPYDNAAVDGRGTLTGFVYTDQNVTAGDDVAAPILDHGKVKPDLLPIAVDAAGQADVAGRIIFLG